MIKIDQTHFLVTGGSGSLGKEIIKGLLKRGARNIASVSRDENLIKQAQLEIGSPIVEFKLGDITDVNLISRLTKDIDVIFNTAAIKHVSIAEENPRETHRVNIIGLLNLLDQSHPKRFIHVSSDKVIGAMNCYGASKLLGEYLVKESNRLYSGKYIIIRCPNILGSRGSVLDLWQQQVKKNNEITITDPEMTRYFIMTTLAADFIIQTGLTKTGDKIYYPLKETHKFRLGDLAEVFIDSIGKVKLKVTGPLPGEKKHENYIKDVPLDSRVELKRLLKQVLKDSAVLSD